MQLEAGAERESLGLDEPQLVTLDHDAGFVDNDEAAVCGPGVAGKRDLLVSEHAGHVARLFAVELHAQNKVRSVARARIPACPGVHFATTTK